MINLNQKIHGYRRENNRVGIRNHVIILPVDDISNAACEAVSNNIKGTIALPHPYGRLQFGEDLDLHFRTMIGTGANPNVAAVVVIGIEQTGRKKSLMELLQRVSQFKVFLLRKKVTYKLSLTLQKRLMIWFISQQDFKESHVT